jgi:transcriptional regulator with XRE-family HTH domain
MLEWSQETLAELSGLTPRTVQRVESGQPSSIDTRRAIARAFKCDDLDFFSRPIANPMTPEEAAAKKQAFDRDHVIVPVEVVDGRGIVNRLLGASAIVAGDLPDLSRAGQDAYAQIVDYARDCMDIADEVSRFELLGYGDTIEEMAVPLREAGLCLCVAVRKGNFRLRGEGSSPMPMTLVYMLAAPASSPPSHFVAERNLNGMR